MYQYTEIPGKRYVLSLDNHVEVVEALAAFCREKGILAGNILGLGAVSEATFRFLDPATKQYVLSHSALRTPPFVEAVPYSAVPGRICHCEERSDVAIRSLSPVRRS